MATSNPAPGSMWPTSPRGRSAHPTGSGSWAAFLRRDTSRSRSEQGTWPIAVCVKSRKVCDGVSLTVRLRVCEHRHRNFNPFKEVSNPFAVFVQEAEVGGAQRLAPVSGFALSLLLALATAACQHHGLF